ncbi:MAG: ammonium transporter [Paenibacillus dendritiformis]|uniref:ammonium transporter n=1 Tax=uncultured Paenibacillus sp. TaxID=227322 RepID=UPI0025D4BF33|nr:ammonium transporter [uncultured Paenibacillus sp.]MDU5145327.1 ammonium transporter [Paenibacillus dendritiformis]
MQSNLSIQPPRMSSGWRRWGMAALLGIGWGLSLPVPALAADGPSVESLNTGINALWVMLAAVLVLLMQAGFILLESGSARMKNAGHIAGKTVFTVGLCSLVYWAVGYGLIFGGSGNGLIGWGDFFFNPQGAGGLPPFVFFTFQFAFAAVALSIAWGGFAERAKLSVYVWFTILFTAVIYPVVAHWIWGGGWLAEHGKQDFAGSTVVHLTGAMAALAATLLLKPRLGRFGGKRAPEEIKGHNQVYTTLGVLILWIGWFGFNAGSTLAIDDGFFGYVAMNTQLGAGAGAIAALAISWIVNGKADIPTILNGTLAGLVAITASCAFVEPWAAVLIGLAAGVLVFYSAKLFDKLRIDDPVYALSVHGMAGIWGTLSNGIFATTELAAKVGVGTGGLLDTGSLRQLGVQAYGIAAAGAFAFLASYVLLYGIKQISGLRVREDEEVMGLDLSEHGEYGYPEQMGQLDAAHHNRPASPPLPPPIGHSPAKPAVLRR